ncbi:MAG: diguanylate cyclase [Spirochaetales bacterium]|nr:diguanylate cyclase [Spirochaetales bacterium]
MINIYSRIPTILIVDDQAVNIQTLSNLLKDNYRILVANNGKKALEIVAYDEDIDLILLDITMPGMDGYEVCSKIKDNEKSSRIPIIFITARDSDKEEERGFEIGAEDYIVKPFSPSVVRARVKNHVNLKIKTDLLEELSHMDWLTGIANRRYYEETFQQQWQQAVRSSWDISILMIDIDNFKSYNDHYGHGAGDECLKKVTLALKKEIKRPSDMLARYGGEEFVVILPETDINGAKLVAQSMLSSVIDAAIPHAYSPVSGFVTVSIGCASVKASRSYDSHSLVENADSALYISKKSGKNQVTCFSSKSL